MPEMAYTRLDAQLYIQLLFQMLNMVAQTFTLKYFRILVEKKIQKAPSSTVWQRLLLPSPVLILILFLCKVTPAF